MLTERIKQRELFDFEAEANTTKELEALGMLEECVDHLVLAMATIEKLGIYSREDVEAYVVSYMEAFEKRYYLMGEDAFDKFLQTYLWGRQ